MRSPVVLLLLLASLAGDAVAFGWLRGYTVRIYHRQPAPRRVPPRPPGRTPDYLARVLKGEEGAGVYLRVDVEAWVYDLGGRRLAPTTTTRLEPDLTGDAWQALRASRADDAATAFGHLLGRRPKEPVLTIGYALATAQQGQTQRSARAFRRAVAESADAVALIELDAPLRARVGELAQRFAAIEDPDRDEAFATAALYYLLRERDKAESAITPHLRPRDTTAAELVRLIEAVG